MNKVFDNFDTAVADIPDGAAIMVGGFGLCGIPETLIKALVRKNARKLHTISNNVGVDGFGMGLMLEAGMIASHIGSYVGENKLLEEMVMAGRLDLKLIPQGTLSERIRAGGAGFLRFILQPESAQSSPTAKKCANSMAAGICSNMHCTPTSPLSRRGRATGLAISFTARRHVTSIP